MPTANGARRPEVTIERVVEWYDTDASGHQHNSVVVRWVEAAEAELLRRQGLEWLFGRIPRVRHEVNYRNRVRFGEAVTIRLRVEELGRTSLRWSFEVTGQEGPVADGTVVVVCASPDSPTATPWPPDVRAALTGEREVNAQ
ncbi:acyl-CoA thioesterase [Streptomyces sp. NPDC004838]